MPDDVDTQESDNIILDGPANTRGAKASDPAPKPAEGREKKRKRGALVDEKVLVCTSMTEAVREVAIIIANISTIILKSKGERGSP